MSRRVFKASLFAISRPMEKPQRATYFLRSASVLESMQATLADQTRMRALVHSLLPANLAPHCLSVQSKDGQLLIYADSSAWASRLRFFTRDLTVRLREAGLTVKKITVRVLLANPERPKPSRCARQLSADNAALLAAVAEGINDTELANALRRLSRHVRR